MVGNRFQTQRGVQNMKPNIRPGIKKAANKVFGGAKAVGRVAVKPIKWAGAQIEKEMKMNKAKDNRYRAEGKALNRKYSK